MTVSKVTLYKANKHCSIKLPCCSNLYEQICCVDVTIFVHPNTVKFTVCLKRLLFSCVF